jgi:hypothetical protein
VPPEVGAFHVNVAVEPTALTASPVGAPGTGAAAGSVTVTAVDSGPVPNALVAVRLMTNVPLGAVIPKVVTAPTGNVATTGPPGARRASSV